MTRYMWDACSQGNIPYGSVQPGDLVAGYIDGTCRWASQPQVPISSTGTNNGVVLDVEPQNLNAAQSVDWVLGRRAAGVEPTIYTAEWAPGYTWGDVNAAFNSRSQTPPHVWLSGGGWVHLPADPQVVAVQFGLDIAPGYDISEVRDYWPGVDPQPVAQSSRPLYAAGGQMIQILETPSGRCDVLLIGGDRQLWWHAGQGMYAALSSSGTPCGGDLRSFSCSYWSDYSHIDVVAISNDGTMRGLQIYIANGNPGNWSNPYTGPVLTPLGHVPPSMTPV